MSQCLWPPLGPAPQTLTAPRESGCSRTPLRGSPGTTGLGEIRENLSSEVHSLALLSTHASHLWSQTFLSESKAELYPSGTPIHLHFIVAPPETSLQVKTTQKQPQSPAKTQEAFWQERDRDQNKQKHLFSSILETSL